MSILLKGFEMPKACMNAGCPIGGEYCGLWWKAGGGEYGRHRDCPLVEIPSHGRLVDWDEVEKCIEETEDCDIKQYALSLISWAAEKRVVIEASEVR